jgi:hypothetical protein
MNKKLITLIIILVNLLIGILEYSICNFKTVCYSFTIFGMMLMLLIIQITTKDE